MSFIKNMAPSWFAVVMGTGIFAIASQYYAAVFPILSVVGWLLFALTAVIYVLLLIPWLLRWILHFNEALHDLYHPIHTNFYPTFSIATLILSIAVLLFLKNVPVAFVLWVVGTVVGFFFSFLIPYILFTHTEIKVEHINPAWFIPPVGLIIIPIAGAHFVTFADPSSLLHQVLVVVNVSAWATAFFLFLALFAITVYRFIIHHPLPQVLAPTTWINIAPLGAGAISLLSLVKNVSFLKLPVLKVIAFGMWGFGVWWLVMAIVLTLHYLKDVEFKFALSWWAFTFPTGALAVASVKVSHVFLLPLVMSMGFCTYVLLAGIWLVTAIKTVEMVLKGKS